jgi:hypothetical protein
MYSLNDYVELPRKMYWPYAYDPREHSHRDV